MNTAEEYEKLLIENRKSFREGLRRQRKANKILHDRIELLCKEKDMAVKEAVKLALETAAEKGLAFSGVDDEPLVSRGSILSLKEEVLAKLKEKL